jgi:hypothetical protein
MTGQRVYLGGAVALMLGGVSGIVVHLLHLGHPTTVEQLAPYVATSAPVHALLLAAVVLTILGLPAVPFVKPPASDSMASSGSRSCSSA